MLKMGCFSGRVQNVPKSVGGTLGLDGKMRTGLTLSPPPKLADAWCSAGNEKGNDPYKPSNWWICLIQGSPDFIPTFPTEHQQACFPSKPQKGNPHKRQTLSAPLPFHLPQDFVFCWFFLGPPARWPLSHPLWRAPLK